MVSRRERLRRCCGPTALTTPMGVATAKVSWVSCVGGRVRVRVRVGLGLGLGLGLELVLGLGLGLG